MERKLNELGIQAMKHDGVAYSALEKDRLITLAANNKTVAEIADILGRTETSVKRKANELHVAIKDHERRWTIEDMDTLRRQWGRVSLKSLAAELKRSEQAVIGRARVLHLPKCYLESEDIPLSEFSRDTGISRHRITKTLAIKFGFPIKSMKPGEKRLYLYVDINEILPWLERNQPLYSAANIPQYYFGEEPEWLVEKRKKDSNVDSKTILGKFDMKRWTEEEFCLARDWVAMGISQAEVASRLGRSENSVRNKLGRAGLSYSGRQYWKGKEFRILRDDAKEKSDAELAQELGRSESAIGHHRRFMGISRKAMNDKKREEVKKYIKKHWKTMSDKEIADHFGRAPGGIKDLRLSMGLSRGTNQYGKYK